MTTKYNDYITEFMYFCKKYDISFVKYKNNETESDKEDIIKFFSEYFPEYKFYNSYQHTAFFFEKIARKD